MRISKKIFAIALSVLMAVSMMPFTAFAASLPEVNVTANGAKKVTTDGGQVALDATYAFEAVETAAQANVSPFRNYICDFVVSFDKDIAADTVTLAGQYNEFGPNWVAFDLPAMNAGDEVKLVESYSTATGNEYKVTYHEICNLVKTFNCGVAGVPVGTTMTVSLNIYENATDEGTTIATQTYTATLPVATIDENGPATVTTTEGDIDLLASYTFSATETADQVKLSPYRDYICDFVVSFDKDIAEGAVTLAGQYDKWNANWIAFDLPALEAGKEVKLVAAYAEATGNDYVVTYEDICKTVQTFNCGVKGTAAGVTMTVALNLYKDATSDPITVASRSFTFADSREDEYSITTSDEVDLNIYIDKDNVSAVRYTFNKTEEKEEDNQGSVTVPASALEVDPANDKYTYSVVVAPAQIEDDITIEVIDNNNVVVATYQTSVADYCHDIIDDANASETDKALAKSTLDYGKAAAELFDYENKDKFDADYYNVAAFDFEPYKYGFKAENTTGLTISEVTYRAVSVPELRFVLNMSEADAANLVVEASQVGNTDISATVAKVDGTGNIVIAVTGVKAALFDKEVTVTVEGRGEIVYTPLIYAYNAAKSNDPALKQLGNSIGYYFVAAKAAFIQ